MKIPFLSFKYMNSEIKPQIISAFKQFFEDGWYILGSHLKKFEDEYAAFNEVDHCVGVSNGLDALHLSLKALGVGEGDEVIVPSNTYIATLLAVSYVSAKPILVEPDILTYNIDIKKIEEVITSKTKAIIPVHLYGQACNMSSIMEIAQKYNLYVVEDNAQAHGAKWNGKVTGGWGHVNATSFYPGKNLGAYGDAGAITTNEEKYEKVIKLFRNYGSDKKYFNDVIGYNMRLDECQASFLTIKLQYLKKWNEYRIAIAERYNSGLQGIGDIVTPFVMDGATHVYHLYVIRTKKRDLLQKYLADHGVGTLIHYPVPPHLQKAYKQLGYMKGDFPIAEEIADTCLSLPIWPGMDPNMVEMVIRHCKDFFNEI